jgi:WhiB family transcriptional regulator, redox-sensing transcriptional regulator
MAEMHASRPPPDHLAAARPEMKGMARENLHEHPTNVVAAAQPSYHAQTGVAVVDWRHRSACLDEDPELFFPIGNTGPAILQIEEAKAVCRRCDVREQCLAWALEAGQDHGVWGGLSEDERRALKRRNARAKIRA